MALAGTPHPSSYCHSARDCIGKRAGMCRDGRLRPRFDAWSAAAGSTCSFRIADPTAKHSCCDRLVLCVLFYRRCNRILGRVPVYAYRIPGATWCKCCTFGARLHIKIFAVRVGACQCRHHSLAVAGQMAHGTYSTSVMEKPGFARKRGNPSLVVGDDFAPPPSRSCAKLSIACQPHRATGSTRRLHCRACRPTRTSGRLGVFGWISSRRIDSDCNRTLRLLASIRNFEETNITCNRLEFAGS